MSVGIETQTPDICTWRSILSAVEASRGDDQ